MSCHDDHMLRATRNLGQLAGELHDDWPGIREELEQVAADARRSFSRVEVAATAVTVTMVAIGVAVVIALILSTVAVVSSRD
jgi:hypothetical protein